MKIKDKVLFRKSQRYAKCSIRVSQKNKSESELVWSFAMSQLRKAYGL